MLTLEKGASGGPTILSSVFQCLQEILFLKRTVTPKQAVDEPRFHVQVGKEGVLVENGFSTEIMKALNQKGHSFTSIVCHFS